MNQDVLSVDVIQSSKVLQAQKSESVIRLFFLKVVISTFATRKCISALLKLEKRA